MIYLRELSFDDGREIYEMLQEIAANDNGFHNKAYGMTYDQFREWLAHEYAVDHGNLEDWMVPQTSYWLYDDEKVIGYGRLRHVLNENLKKTSGHIGYAIRHTERGKGYGTKLLSLLLDECKRMQIQTVQIGANSNNAASNRIIIKNGGMLVRSSGNKNFYSSELGKRVLFPIQFQLASC